MACQYFNEDYVGYCSASALPYIPSICELEGQCFKDFLTCPIYNEFRSANTVTAENS